MMTSSVVAGEPSRKETLKFFTPWFTGGRAMGRSRRELRGKGEGAGRC